MSEERIKALEARVAKLEGIITATATALGGGGASGGKVAPDRELDDPQYGDELVKRDPPRWRAESFAGRRMSQCPPDYLDALAEFQDWCAEREAADPAKAKYARYSTSRAAKARGWAARLRAGWKPKSPTNGVGASYRDDPFATRNSTGLGSNGDRGDAWEPSDDDPGF